MEHHMEGWQSMAPGFWDTFHPTATTTTTTKKKKI